MKTSIEIANLTSKKISVALVKKIISKTLKLSGLERGDFSVSAVFLGKSEIKKLNRKYRKKNRSTDVLSFIYNSGYNKKEKALASPPVPLCQALRAGELALCPEIIAKHAKENKVVFQKELAFVLSHGVLHLLGFRHGKKMYQIQDRISNIKF